MPLPRNPGNSVEYKVESVNAERTNVRFAVYSDGVIWLKVSFVRDAHGRVYSLFRCRQFYNERGQLADEGRTVLIPGKTYKELARRAAGILK